MLHARMRQSLDATTDDERHWAFRAIAATNAVAAQNRIKKAWSATGLGIGSDRRELFLMRNSPWPAGPKTAELVDDFKAAGGRTLAVTDDDMRTMTALRDLIGEDAAELTSWLRARRPAHGLTILREALGDEAHTTAGAGPRAAGRAGIVARQRRRSRGGHTGHGAAPRGRPQHRRCRRRRSRRAAQAHCHLRGPGSGKTVLIRRLVEECALRGVSSIVLDPNNDLSRLGTAWPDGRATDYLDNTEVVIWTPRKASGRPLAFQPLPTFPASSMTATSSTRPSNPPPPHSNRAR